MELKKQFAAMNDEDLDQVTGGYLEVSKWRAYVSNSVMPAINPIMNSASANDRAIINTVCSVFQGTMVPGAAVAEPIRNLWNDFNLRYRDRLESQNVKNSLGQVISDAKDYISRNA